MSKHLSRSVLPVFVALVVALPAGLAFACVGVMSLTTEVTRVEPGGTVPVTGRGFAQAAPVEIRLDSPSGQLLATAPPPMSTMTSVFTIPVVIPADVPKGQHLLVAVQNYHHMNAGSPARATIQVGAEAPVLGAGEDVRPTALTEGSGPGGGLLLLIGLGVAAAGLLLAGFVNLLVARRQAQPEPAKATA